MDGAAIPEDAEAMVSKQPRNNQFRVVVALCVGVLIGALGTAMMLPVVTKDTEAPTPAPRPILVMDPEIEMSEDLHACMNSLSGCRKQLEACASTSRPVTTSLAAMELDAQSHCGSEVVSCCKKADHALAMCARLPCFPGTCKL